MKARWAAKRARAEAMEAWRSHPPRETSWRLWGRGEDQIFLVLARRAVGIGIWQKEFERCQRAGTEIAEGEFYKCEGCVDRTGTRSGVTRFRKRHPFDLVAVRFRRASHIARITHGAESELYLVLWRGSIETRMGLPSKRRRAFFSAGRGASTQQRWR